MTRKVVVVALCAIALLAIALPVVQAKNSGACAGCTLGVSLIHQYTLTHGGNVANSLKTLCKYLANKDSTIEFVCNLAAGSFAGAIQADLDKLVPPEIACQTTFKMCNEFSQCRIYDSWPPKHVSLDTLLNHFNTANTNVKDDFDMTAVETARARLNSDVTLQKFLKLAMTAFVEKLGLSYRRENTLGEMKDAMNELLGEAGVSTPVIDHYPLVDDDKDHFSTIETLRGTDWRGKDCDDKNANVYPGRRASDLGPNVDHNCNGIKGVAPDGQSYEDKLCSGTKQYGLIALGDSATAHFSVPPKWITPSTIGEKTYADLFSVISNEADYPHCASSTGHGDPARCPDAKGYNFTSLYMKIKERNYCSHRDYQNVGVNGAASHSMKPPGIITTLARNPKADHPVIVIYALIGNDVCGHRYDEASMTTVNDFTNSTIQSLRYLDTVLPAGSHVLLAGLVDGRVLFNSMKDKIHPVGTGYPKLYDYLNCLDTSPCAGWMNVDESVRDRTTRRATELSNVYPLLVAQQDYKNFKIYNVPTMSLMNDVVSAWKRAGKDPADLVELTDGFHPTTLAQRLLADHTWNYIRTNLTYIDIPINPNNGEIKRIFGDQGGY